MNILRTLKAGWVCFSVGIAAAHLAAAPLVNAAMPDVKAPAKTASHRAVAVNFLIQPGPPPAAATQQLPQEVQRPLRLLDNIQAYQSLTLSLDGVLTKRRFFTLAERRAIQNAISELQLLQKVIATDAQWMDQMITENSSQYEKNFNPAVTALKLNNRQEAELRGLISQSGGTVPFLRSSLQQVISGVKSDSQQLYRISSNLEAGKKDRSSFTCRWGSRACWATLGVIAVTLGVSIGSIWFHQYWVIQRLIGWYGNLLLAFIATCLD